MQPNFSMKSDSADPEITSCVAYWEFAGGKVSLKCQTGVYAFRMNRIITDAYLAGVKDGNKEAHNTVINALGLFKE